MIRDAEGANFCGSMKRLKGTASTLVVHIERRKLKCGAMFCKTFDEKL